MRQVVYKYEVTGTRVKLPTGYRILCVGQQGPSIMVWALVPAGDAALNSYTEVTFRVHGTGHHFDGGGQTYLGTVEQGPFVWHVFEEVHD